MYFLEITGDLEVKYVEASLNFNNLAEINYSPDTLSVKLGQKVIDLVVEYELNSGELTLSFDPYTLSCYTSLIPEHIQLELSYSLDFLDSNLIPSFINFDEEKLEIKVYSLN